MKLWALVASLALGAFPSASASAQDSTNKTSILPGGFIFEFHENQDTAPFLNKLKDHGTVRLQMSYGLFRGVSVNLKDIESSDATIALLSAMPVVKNTWPIHTIPTGANGDAKNAKSQPSERKKGSKSPSLGKSPTGATAGDKSQSKTSGPFTPPYRPHMTTQVEKLHAAGFTGKGFKIAILSTGIDYDHPSLGGCFGQGCLVESGWDYVGDNEEGPPKPDDDPIDSEGRGTEIAGIIAAQPNGRLNITGVAPGVKLAAYRVSNSRFSATTDVLIAAHYRAVDDGANIIVGSIVGSDASASAALSATEARIAAKGVHVVRDGSGSSYETIYYPNSLFKRPYPIPGNAITYAGASGASQMATFFYRSTYSVDGGPPQDFGYQDGFKWGGRIDLKENLKRKLITFGLDTNSPGDACKDLPPGTPADLSQYVVLTNITRCEMNTAGSNLFFKANANAFLFFSDKPGVLNPDWPSVSQIPFGVVSPVGQELMKLLKAGKNVTLDMAPESTTAMYLETTNSIDNAGAMYGELGPTMNMEIGPQFFCSPGRDSVSTALGGGFTVTDSPDGYTAGVYALLGEALGTKDFLKIRNALTATSKAQLIFDFETKKFLPYLETVANQGAGLIQAYDAVHSKLALEPSTLSFNDSDHFIREASVTLTNINNQAVTYKLSNVVAKTQNHAITGQEPKYDDATAQIAFSDSSITLQPGKSATIKVRPTAPKISDPKRLALWSGWVTVNGTDGTNASVPYIGLTGSLYGTKLIPGYGDPGKFYNISIVTSRNSTYFRAFYKSVLPSRIGRYILLDGNSNKKVGELAGSPKSPAPCDSTGCLFESEGILTNRSRIANGKYKVQVRELRIYGDEKKESDFDVDTSAAFDIPYKPKD